MRQVGTIPTESQARIFRSYLIGIGIKNDVDQNRDGSWAIWIHDELKLQEGKAELEKFLEDPKNPRYHQIAKKGVKQEQKDERENKKFRSQIVDMRTKFGTKAVPQLPIFFTAICVGVFLIQNLFPDVPVQQWLSIGSIVSDGEYLYGNKTFSDVTTRGQIWRLVTPVFMHFGILHILFNMAWLMRFGSVIEEEEGKGFFLRLFLVSAILSNVLQFVLTSNPFFGGMSGVVYALFGYFWIMGLYKKPEVYGLNKDIIVIIIGWFFLCFTGWVGNIANWAHAGGLITGVVWAAIKARRIPFTKIRF